MEKIVELENVINDVKKKVEECLVLKWKFRQGIEGGERQDIDDSGWEEKNSPCIWSMKNGVAYLRTIFTIPEKIEGVEIENSDIYIEFVSPSGVSMFINGKEVYSYKFWADMVAHPYPLVKKAVPGEKHLIVFKTPAGDGLGTFWGKISVSRIEDILFELNSILHQLKFASDISDKERKLKPYVEEALNIINQQDIINRNWDKVLQDIKKAETILEPFRKEAKKFTVHLIGHAHIDMNWLWTYEDTVNVCLRDFATVTKLMDKYPDLTFSQSQAHIYKIVEEHNPSLFENVKEKVKEGRWDITASSWVECDLNMADGESILRHILYSNKYTSDRFGVRPEIFWSPDTFGHSETTPSILASAGIKYYYFMRCGKGMPLLRWKGKDRKEIIAFNSIYNNRISPETIIPVFIEFCRKYKNISDFLFVYGVGDHGGGPTEADIKRKKKMEEKPVFPTLKFSTTHRYFRAVEKHRNKLPAISGELNTIFEGCYTTHSDIKKANREGETLLLSLEALSAMASIKGISVDEKKLEELWQTVLFNQFHDIIDGSAIHSSYEYSGKLAEEVKRKGELLIKEVMEKLVSHKETGEVIVFNPLGWRRKAIIEGNCIVDIPGYGYKTFHLKDAGKTSVEVINTGNNYEYENEFYKVVIEGTKGLIKKLYDKRNRCDVLSSFRPLPEDPSSWWAEKSGNLLSVFWEEPHTMSAWIIGNIYRIDNLLKADYIKKENDAFKTTLYIKRVYRNSEILQKIILYNDLPFIDFENEINWNEEGNNKEGVPMLRVNFHTSLKNPETYFEVPFGVIKRDTNGKEYPALRWAGQKDGNYWVVLMNKEKYGYHIDGNNLSLTLLRNPYEPDALPDKGKHYVSCRLFFGKTDPLEITKLAMEYNIPPLIISGESEPEEFYPFVIKGNILPTCFKKAVGRTSYILRLVEIKGKRESVKVEFVRKPEKVYIANSVEKREKQVKLKGKELKLNFSPFQILTLDIQF